jgi:uncharacterized protein
MDPQRNAEKLEEFFKKQGHAIVAYSGGVDSALLAYAANRALGNKMVAVLADSPSLARREYRSALNFAQIHSIPLQIIRTDEMENPKYQINRSDRCYYCKQALFKKIEALREQLQGTSKVMSWPVCYGVNLDDLGDHRPGIQAAREASTQELWRGSHSGKTQSGGKSRRFSLRSRFPCFAGSASRRNGQNRSSSGRFRGPAG